MPINVLDRLEGILKNELGIKNISMASPEKVLRLTDAKVGEVCLINPGMKTLIDKNVLENKNCFGGCGTPNTTLRISTLDFVRITDASIFDFIE